MTGPRLTLLLLCLVACSQAEAQSGGEPTSADAATDGGGPTFGGDGAPACTGVRPPTLDPKLGRIAAPFASSYEAFDLGPMPLPDGETDPLALNPLGGCVVGQRAVFADEDTMAFVARSERADAAIYSVRLKRDGCGHIVGFDGRPKRLASVPFADASLVLTPARTLLVPQYPRASITELATDMSVLRTSELVPLGVDGPVDGTAVDLAAGESPGGLAIVPSFLAGRGGLRALAFPSGRFFDLGAAGTVPGAPIAGATSQVMLDHGPGGLAYVPPGSPGFPEASLLVSEWYRGRFTPEKNMNPSPDTQRVAAYRVDERGTPVPSSRQDFFESFDRPWGAYFEPVTGDFIFLSWSFSGTKTPDHVVIVRGFAPPPR